MKRSRTWTHVVAMVPVLALSSCNKHVFEVVPRDCTQQEDVLKPQEVDVPADILVVVDTSGSMCEEQANLVENFFDDDCRLTDLNNIPEEYKNPAGAVLETLAQECGFVQILAAYDNDWRIGVISTDVGQCDNRFALAEAGIASCGQAYPGWGRRPQRGCLQPYNVNDRENTLVLNSGEPDVAAKFANILEGMRTFGSAFERGLDAMQLFLSPSTDRAPGCENDLDTFLRPEAKLVVIFLTDEDDCSHADGTFPEGDPFVDENDGESCENATEIPPQARTPPAAPKDCYERKDELAPVSRYANFLKAYKGDPNRVSVAVIAGGLVNGNEVEAAGCRVGSGGSPVGQCYESGGNSNQTSPPAADGSGGGMCHPDVLLRDYGVTEPCCSADPGSRYFELARQMIDGQHYRTNSICFASFRQTMVDIAAFIAADEQVILSETPASPESIIVEITRANEAEASPIERIPDGENPDGKNGWQYDGDKTITFYGSAKPRPGDTVHVSALQERDDPQNLCSNGDEE